MTLPDPASAEGPAFVWVGRMDCKTRFAAAVVLG